MKASLSDKALLTKRSGSNQLTYYTNAPEKALRDYHYNDKLSREDISFSALLPVERI